MDTLMSPLIKDTSNLFMLPAYTDEALQSYIKTKSNR